MKRDTMEKLYGVCALSMKRCMNLVRLLLKTAEKQDEYRLGMEPPVIEGYTERQIEYHILLCAEAGYVRVNAGGDIVRLTWTGHEALEHLNKQ